ncbi:MAG: hypothetical protein PVF43_12930 [Candidatus Eiseniibacteriota bacterium]|jgi:hypothetical protein
MNETIHTLQEFMTQTKGVVYLLAIGYLVGFVAFWRFLFGRGR